MLNKEFTATLQKGVHKGSWTRVIMPDSAEYFGTRGVIKVKARIDNHPFEGSFIPVGDGTHMLPINAGIRKAIGKDVGDKVTVLLDERLDS